MTQAQIQRKRLAYFNDQLAIELLADKPDEVYIEDLQLNIRLISEWLARNDGLEYPLIRASH